MKKILITGTKGYIAIKVKTWLEKKPNDFRIDMLNVRGNEWKNINFDKYDTIIHTAAIVHSDSKKEEEYKTINIDLTKEIALKAKASGVKHFIFFSTMGVYGIEDGYIDIKTTPKPKTEYAKSKFKAESILDSLVSNTFKVTILRPPLVYGENCPGNYKRLSNFAKKTIIFPKVNNERSMIYIMNLCEFIEQVIRYEIVGIVFPQNFNYVNTSDLVKKVAKENGKKIFIIPYTSIVISIFLQFSSSFRKVFGTLIYDKNMPGGPLTQNNGYQLNYEVIDFEKSINYTENCKVRS